MKKNIDNRPMEYKLEWHKGTTYYLYYRVKDANFFERHFKWWGRWTAFCHYYPPYNVDENPENRIMSWIEEDFNVRSNEEGLALIDRFEKECPTFNDFWIKYRKPQWDRRKKAIANHKAYMDELNKTDIVIKRK